MDKVFKVCSNEEWECIKNDALYEGSKKDQRDGFIHFSTPEQLKETLEHLVFHLKTSFFF